MISDRHWKAGERLPPEPELCEALNVGRSTLREALKSLAFVGLVRIRAGDGTYVAEQSRGLLNRILAKGLLKTEKDLEDVCETRIILETELASLAASRATDADLQQLQSLLEQGETSLRDHSRDFIQIDLDFHLTLAYSSQNNLLPRLLFDIRELLVEWIQKSQELPGLRDNAHSQHEKIFSAVCDRDPERARREMRAHLETFERAYKLLGQINRS